VLAVGTEAAIDALERWLLQGPPLARVEQVARTQAEVAAPTDFSIG